MIELLLLYINNFLYLYFRGNFEIVFGGLQTKLTIFELTAESFLIMCNEYCRVNSHAKSSHIKLLSCELFFIRNFIIFLK